MSILNELIEVEKGILAALGELGEAAGDAVTGTLKAAAEAVHAVIDTVAGDE